MYVNTPTTKMIHTARIVILCFDNHAVQNTGGFLFRGGIGLGSKYCVSSLVGFSLWLGASSCSFLEMRTFSCGGCLEDMLE